MGKKKTRVSAVVYNDGKVEIEGQEPDFERSLKKYLLKCRVINQLSNHDLWNEFKKFFDIHSLDDFGSSCYDYVHAYISTLQGEVDDAMEQSLQTNKSRDLMRLKRKIEPHLRRSGRLRFLLRTQEDRMKGLLRGIDEALRRHGKKPKEIIYPYKPDDLVEDVVCPICGRENKSFNYGECCQYCHEMIGNPWKENTLCPKCNRIINRSDIFASPEAYKLNPETNMITCGCGNEFDWKQYRREPQTFAIKYCIACDKPYVPDKRNWRKQRICSSCKAEGIDPFYLDHPNYQKNYRDRRSRKKVT